MNNFLIAAGAMATMLGASPVLAAPVGGNAPGISALQADNRADHRDAPRDDQRGDQRGHQNGKHWDNGNDHGWRSHQRCHNVRRHHRWVRTCAPR